MQFGRYSFQCRFLDKAYLPFYKGSVFRGAFGAALKRVACAVRNVDCHSCILAQKCIYFRTYERQFDHLSDSGSSPSPPKPFVVEPPISQEIEFAPEDDFNFTLLLFGSITEYLPYFVYAFEKMGEFGIGRPIDGKRGRFQLIDLKSNGHSIYNSKEKALNIGNIDDISLIMHTGNSNGRLIVRLLTPLRIKKDNHLSTRLPFQVLVRAMLRRISTLFQHYDGGEPLLDYKGLVARSYEVKVESIDISWCDWERYSSRQKSRMRLGGIEGVITYIGRIEEYLPLLSLSKNIHIGKQTTFGLGKIDYTWEPE